MRGIFWGRSCPGGAVTFFCLPKRNVSKEKGTPLPVALTGDFPALLTTPGGGFELARPQRGHALKHESADCPPARLRYSAALRGPKSVAVMSLMVFICIPQLFQAG